MVAFRLGHYANKQGCRGEPGDIVDIPEELAQQFEEATPGRRVETAENGAAVAAEVPEGRAPRRRKSKTETAEDARPAEAEQADA